MFAVIAFSTNSYGPEVAPFFIVIFGKNAPPDTQFNTGKSVAVPKLPIVFVILCVSGNKGDQVFGQSLENIDIFVKGLKRPTTLKLNEFDAVIFIEGHLKAVVQIGVCERVRIWRLTKAIIRNVHRSPRLFAVHSKHYRSYSFERDDLKFHGNHLLKITA